MAPDILFLFLVFVLGAWLWLVRYRKFYIEHIFKALYDAASPLVVGYVLLSIALMLLISYHEITGHISPNLFASPFVITVYSFTKNWFIVAVLMSLQAKALGHFSKAFVKNTLVYPRKVFWGCLLLAAPMILYLAALVLGFGLITIVFS